jgi:glycine/D-amino acid oxidase-like deaminating enzyme/nitrite reductase/ring-hydroxylating ferredoxin subunit
VTLASLWQDRHPRTAPAEPVEPTGRFDVAVVGAGLTGLTTALLLARGGRSVVVLEAGRIGDGTTGRSTAKISLLQGTQLATISSRHPQKVVSAYVEAQREGAAWVERFCRDHDVAVQHQDAVTFAHGGSGEKAIRNEQEVANRAGLPVEWVDELPLPFPVPAAIRLPGQFQLDPIELLDELSLQGAAHGVQIVEGARVLRVRGSDPVRITTASGDVDAVRVVVATNLPVLDRGGFFARMKPARSYSIAFRTDRPAVDAMYLSADEPARSLRHAPSDEGPLLLVGGNGHTTGRGGSARQRLDGLRAWTLEFWPEAVETHAWSAQDYVPHHALPYAGPILPGNDEIFVAGGYSKWGMTNAVAASLALSAQLLGSPPGWAQVLRPYAPTELRGLPTATLDNAEVGVEMARGWVGAVATRSIRTGGLTRVCTHLGGVVAWNDAERSWDCPLHGSRFDETGAVLDGPAVRPLPSARRGLELSRADAATDESGRVG